jgi:hypothetical protein
MRGASWQPTTPHAGSRRQINTAAPGRDWTRATPSGQTESLGKALFQLVIALGQFLFLLVVLAIILWFMGAVAWTMFTGH